MKVIKLEEKFPNLTQDDIEVIESRGLDAQLLKEHLKDGINWDRNIIMVTSGYILDDEEIINKTLKRLSDFSAVKDIIPEQRGEWNELPSVVKKMK